MISPEQAKLREHTFVVHNTSIAPLTITGFKSSCKCTVAQLPKSPIVPGGNAEVSVRADWSDVVGSMYSQVTLETDNRWTPKVPLRINAEIVPTTPPASW